MLRRAATGAVLRDETRALRRAATDTVENATEDAIALDGRVRECVRRTYTSDATVGRLRELALSRVHRGDAQRACD